MNIMVQNTTVDDSSSKIKSFIYKMRNFHDKKERPLGLNSILDDLNALNCSCIALEDRLTCIQLCCALITPSDVMLTGKCSQMMNRFIINQQISEETSTFIIEWCIQALPKSTDLSQIELLTVIEHVFRCEFDSHKRLIGSILKLVKIPVDIKSKTLYPGEVLIRRLHCIRTMIPAMTLDQHKDVKDILLQLFQNDWSSKNSLKSQIALTELEILHLLCSQNEESWLTENLGVILGICLAFSSYGLPHHVECIPLYLLPTPLHPENKPSNYKTNKSKHKKKKKNVEEKIKSAPIDESPIVDLNWSLSESDFSDSEASRLNQLRRSERKIRLAALSLLLYIIKNVSKKELIGYWDNIFSGPYSILKTFSADLSPKSRVTITSILSFLFTSGKMYLSQAQHSSRSTGMPYVSWSQLLADLIISAHETLCNVLEQPQSTISILSILNCLIIFIQNTPYHRLNDGALTKVVHSITPSLKNVDAAIRSSAIRCLVEVVVLESNTREQILLMRNNEVYHASNSEDSWIFSYCMQTLKNNKNPVTVRSECWLLIGALAKHHFITNISTENLKQILTVLPKDLTDGNVVIQKNSAKAFEQIAIPVGSLDASCGIDCYEVWLSILQGPLVPMLQSTSGTLAAAAADCIANITCPVFEKLPEGLRIFIMTALFGCVGHEEHFARSAAARTLGTIVVFPFLSENIQIIYDVADRIVCALGDENLTVRMKAAWALGNVSDVLLIGREIGVPTEEVPLLNVLELAVKTSNDHEKVKASSMRAIGNLFLLVEKQHLQINRFKELVVEGSVALMKNSSTENNMKVRWNACYSLGNMFKNVLLLEFVNTGWQFKCFEILSKLIVNCTNFKVRQAASNALCVVSKREYYGDYYQIMWQALKKAFENSQNLPDFAEYKHQRNLIDQLCLLLIHLSCFLTAQDFTYLSSALPEDVDACAKYVAELKKRNFGADELTVAVENINKLIESISPSEQISCASILFRILNSK